MDRKKQLRVLELDPDLRFVRGQASQQSSAAATAGSPATSRSNKLLMEMQEQQESTAPATPLTHFLYREEEKVPMFLVKMWNILEDPKFQNIIRWDKVISYEIFYTYLFRAAQMTLNNSL
ncbi:unnamed protein product [Gongylonema pulchrum]|uniref:ChSh domain-containing protein n=1 Tax=Gongylonema pulchrum TaxID=637853 RepID=A0A183EBU6_9BILA|nr:unnamed protein product [Gongylonema pulchrum]